MKNYLLILIGLLFLQHSFAQNNSIEAARVAFITQKIGLTSAQAEKFWPLFNELANQKAEVKNPSKQ